MALFASNGWGYIGERGINSCLLGGGGVETKMIRKMKDSRLGVAGTKIVDTTTGPHCSVQIPGSTQYLLRALGYTEEEVK